MNIVLYYYEFLQQDKLAAKNGIIWKNQLTMTKEKTILNMINNGYNSQIL